jgi:hypothetical protein
MNRLPQSFCGEFVPLELLSPSRTRGALRVCKRRNATPVHAPERKLRFENRPILDPVLWSEFRSSEQKAMAEDRLWLIYWQSQRYRTSRVEC